MTPLKQPIVVKIETVQAAVNLWHRTNCGIVQSRTVNGIDDWILPTINDHNSSVWFQINKALVDAGIDPHKAPPAPLRVGNYEVEALEGGAIKVGCTTVDRTTLEAILKLSSEAMGGEWPKYYKNTCGMVIRFDSESHQGEWANSKYASYWSNHADCANHKDMKPLTPAQAREILAGGSKEQTK